MNRHRIGKSSIFLLAIIAVFIAAIGFLAFNARTRDLESHFQADRIFNIAFILSDNNKIVSTQIFMFYPANGHAALLDIPGELGLIIQSLNRFDRIDALYNHQKPDAYVLEISKVVDEEIQYWIDLDSVSLASFVDLLGGVEIFIPNAIEVKTPTPILISQGVNLLDGDKVQQYCTYSVTGEDRTTASSRYQKLVQALLQRLSTSSDWLALPGAFELFKKVIRTNIPDSIMKRFLASLANLNSDRLVVQKVAGVYRKVEQSDLLFPYHDGQLIKDTMKQTHNALANPANTIADKVYTIEILNGTSTKGLARKASDVFASFGYEVLEIGNATSDDISKTSIVDHGPNEEALRNIAGIIGCTNFSNQGNAKSNRNFDFTVILGRDFNGRAINK